MTHRDLLRASIWARYPQGVNLTAEGLRQLVDRVYDAAYEKGVEDGLRSSQGAEPPAGFADLINKLFKHRK